MFHALAELWAGLKWKNLLCVSRSLTESIIQREIPLITALSHRGWTHRKLSTCAGVTQEAARMSTERAVIKGAVTRRKHRPRTCIRGGGRARGKKLSHTHACDDRSRHLAQPPKDWRASCSVQFYSGDFLWNRHCRALGPPPETLHPISTWLIFTLDTPLPATSFKHTAVGGSLDFIWSLKGQGEITPVTRLWHHRGNFLRFGYFRATKDNSLFLELSDDE